MTYDLTCQYPTNPDPLVFFQDADIDRSALLHAYYQYIINNRFDEAKEYFNNSDLHGYNASFLNMIETRLRNVEENIDTVLGNEIPLVLHQENQPTGSYVTDGFNWVGGNSGLTKPIIIQLQDQETSFSWNIQEYTSEYGLIPANNVLVHFYYNDIYTNPRYTITKGNSNIGSGSISTSISTNSNTLSARNTCSATHNVMGSKITYAKAIPYIIYPDIKTVGIKDLGEYTTYINNQVLAVTINIADICSDYNQVTNNNFIVVPIDERKGYSSTYTADETNTFLHCQYTCIREYNSNTGILSVTRVCYGIGDSYGWPRFKVYFIPPTSPFYNYNNWREGL